MSSSALFHFPHMTKKEYKKPDIKIIYIDAVDVLLAGAGSTGATGEDVPWAVKGRNRRIDDDLDWD